MVSEVKFEIVVGSRGVVGIGEGRWLLGVMVLWVLVWCIGVGMGGGGVDSRMVGLVRDGVGIWWLEGWWRGERVSLYGIFW